MYSVYVHVFNHDQKSVNLYTCTFVPLQPLGTPICKHPAQQIHMQVTISDLHPQLLRTTQHITHSWKVEYVRKSVYKRSDGQLHTKDVGDLAGEDEDSHCCGITRYKGLRQEDAYKAHLETSHHKLHIHIQVIRKNSQ